MPLRFAIWLVAASAAVAQPPSVEEIMSRVAANQDQAELARGSFVYDQKLLMRFHRGNGRLAREERAEYLVLPAGHGVEKKLVAFAGRYEHKGQYVAFDKPGYNYKELDLDAEIMHEFAEEMTDDRHSKDGIGKDLFPLNLAEQRKYKFALAGTETYRGRKTWKVHFQPRPGDDSGTWAGEALIDSEEFQPVLVSTRLAARIPLWVRTVLGTSVKGVGFSLRYERFADGVWFPVSYGGEFEVRAAFFYRRIMSISLTNSNFRRAGAVSTVAYHMDGP